MIKNKIKKIMNFQQYNQYLINIKKKYKQKINK